MPKKTITAARAEKLASKARLGWTPEIEDYEGEHGQKPTEKEWKAYLAQLEREDEEDAPAAEMEREREREWHRELAAKQAERGRRQIKTQADYEREEEEKNRRLGIHG